MEVTLTEEQQDIFDFVSVLFSDKKYNSMAIKAFAGCGKSFILKYIANQYKKKKILGLAFNSSIVEENRKSFPKRNSKWFTVHGFAREYLKKMNVAFDFKNCVNGYKAIELFDLVNISTKGDYLLANSVNVVFKVYCQSSLTKIIPDDIRKAGTAQLNNDIITLNDSYLILACKYAQKLWDRFVKNEIPITHDFYLKYFEVNRFSEKITEFDLMELDEAQDSNAVTMSIVTQLPTKNIYVGDEHQSIYGFRGTLNAMQFADKLFYLSTTFRYIPKIANFANEILKGYKNEQTAIKSLAKDNGSIDEVTAYLSRNNSTMISVIAEFVKDDKKFRTSKKPDELFEVAIALYEFLKHKTIFSDKYNYLRNIESRDEEGLEEYILETNDNELKTAFKMQKRYKGGLYIFLKKAKEYYKSKEDISIVLSTAHTSKGLEWDNVKLLNDFPNIKKLIADAKIESKNDLLKRWKANDYKASNIIQEINLYYVAVTRARFEVIEE